jgi:hypoxanthine phosphoribosyltransferase
MTSKDRNPKIFASRERINNRLQLIANKIENDYSGLEIDLVYSLTGASLFVLDLARMINLPINLHPIFFKSYTPPSNNGEVEFLLDVTRPLKRRHVIFVDGIVISGKTPLYVMNVLRQRQPASLEICVVGSKATELTVDLGIKYQLFSLGTEWIEGYGIGSQSNKLADTLLDLS